MLESALFMRIGEDQFSGFNHQKQGVKNYGKGYGGGA